MTARRSCAASQRHAPDPRRANLVSAQAAREMRQYRAGRVVSGSQAKSLPPQLPVGADVPRSRAAPRLTPSVYRRASARRTLPTRITWMRNFDFGAILHQFSLINNVFLKNFSLRGTTGSEQWSERVVPLAINATLFSFPNSSERTSETFGTSAIGSVKQSSV